MGGSSRVFVGQLTGCACNICTVITLPTHLIRAGLWVALVSAFSLAADDLPDGVVNTQNPADVSLSPAVSLSRMLVPDGFSVSLFAGEPNIRRPIAFDIDDRGRLWVVENYSHPEWRSDNATDRIVILEDADNDGRFDKRTVFWDQGRYLTGIALGYGGVWLANTPELSFIPDRNRDDVPDSEPVAKLDGFRVSSNNVVNNFHWGPDGWLYGAIGLSSPSLVGAPGSANDARTRITRGIWRFHPVKERFESVAEGMVNPWGADFNEFGDLFTSNTVIAHLFHIVPGMYCQRRDREVSHPHVYDQIQSITDHLHWGGGVWQSSRQTTDAHSVAGGGHAHCGAMVYLGDNWPDKYRGAFFTANLHGNRINMDHLVPRNSSYTGVHGEDFLIANDPWFRGMSVKYGPDGGVFVSDWHDFGECHDSDGSHRTTGRIYKIVYGETPEVPNDLNSLSSSELVSLHDHKNEWFVRHARRLLHERALAGDEMVEVAKKLRSAIASSSLPQDRLRAFWSLHSIGLTSESELLAYAGNPCEHLRRWAIRFLVEDRAASDAAQDALIDLAGREPSPKVRLEFACAIQRVSKKNGILLAGALLTQAVDTTDPYIPLMIWYGLEPLVAKEATMALQLAATSRIPQVREYIVRRILSEERPVLGDAIGVMNEISEPRVLKGFLAGMLAALERRGSVTPPPVWKSLSDRISRHSDVEIRSLGVRLATVFGDEDAIRSLQNQLADREGTADGRLRAFAALIKIDQGVSVAQLHQLVKESPALRGEALRAMLTRNNAESADLIVEQFGSFNTQEKHDAVSILATRLSFARTLIDAIRENKIDRRHVSAFALQQLRMFREDELQKDLVAEWSDAEAQLHKSEEIARYKKLLSDDYLSEGSLLRGRQLFEQTCATCHTLFDHGGRIGPDLTGSGRADIDYLLSNLVDPSAIVDDAYRLTTLDLKDGRVMTGFMEQLGDRNLTFRTPQGAFNLAMAEVESIQTSELSMMPEGMLAGFADEEVRDLILYLQNSDQVPLVGDE